MAEDDADVHHSFASLKRRFENKDRSNSSSPSTGTPRTSPARHSPPGTSDTTTPTPTTRNSPATQSNSVKKPKTMTTSAERSQQRKIVPTTTALVKAPQRTSTLSEAADKMAARKQAMLSRMAQMDSECRVAKIPSDFSGLSSEAGDSLCHNVTKASSVQQKTITKISGTRTIIQGSTTRKISQTSLAKAGTTSTSSSSVTSSSSSSSMTSSTTTAHVVRRKVLVTGTPPTPAVLPPSEGGQFGSTEAVSGTGWLFNRADVNRQDFLTQAMESHKQFLQDKLNANSLPKHGVRPEPEGEDDSVYDSVIIKRNPLEPRTVLTSCPPDDYYFGVESDSQHNKSTTDTEFTSPTRSRPVPAPRPASETRTLPSLVSPKLSLFDSTNRSSSLPVKLVNGQSQTTPDNVAPDSESESEDTRYEPVECWSQPESSANQTMASGHVTNQRVTSQDGVTEEQSQHVSKTVRNRRKISAQFQAFKSGIMNKFSGSSEKIRTFSDSSERQSSSSSGQPDSPDGDATRDAKLPSSTSSRQQSRSSVHQSSSSSCHQSSMVCTTLADDSYPSGGLDGMSDDSLHTSMMRALSLDTRGHVIPLSRHGANARNGGEDGHHDDTDSDESISGVYLDPANLVPGVTTGRVPRLSPRQGVRSHVIMQQTTHVSVTKDGDTSGETQHCYMELDDEGVIQRLQRSQRYQSRFGDVAPLYQDFHSAYNRLLPATSNDTQTQASTIYDIAEDIPLYITYDAEAPTYMPYYEAASTPSDDVTITDVTAEEEETVLPSIADELESAKPVMVRTASQRNTVKSSAVRKLWSEMPEVLESGILKDLSAVERRLQEAYFEVITSEASYLKSLNILIDTFLMSKFLSPESGNITRLERHHIFSNIVSVMETSERFLAALEARWSEHFVIEELCDIIRDYAAQYFDVYVVYCTNQIYQIRTMDKLLKKKEFREGLAALERDPRCQLLPMKSFLLLPMQRITRLPLLLNAIHHHANGKDTKLAEEAGSIVSGIVRRCNEGARSMERMEQMVELERQIKFDNIKQIPLISSSRYLIKRGDLIRILPDSTSLTSKIIPGRKAKTKQNISVFLFNDLIVFTKRKSLSRTSGWPQESRLIHLHERLLDLCPYIEKYLYTRDLDKGNEFVAFDYCARIAIEVDLITNPEGDARIPDSVLSTCKNVFILALLENHAGKQLELILNADSPSDQTRWVELLSPAKTANKNEKMYEKWDCPVVKATHSYKAQQGDELSLNENDEIKVTRKMGDGWYEGERLRDGRRGWFPSTFTSEMTSDHLRVKNLRQKYRVNVLSQNLLDQRHATKW